MPDVMVAILAGAGVHLLAVASPGPNFLVISRTALAHSQRTAMFVTFGVTTASFAIVASGFLGASALVTGNPTVFNVVRTTGAVFLIYLGLRALVGVVRARSAHTARTDIPAASAVLGDGRAYRLGLLTMLSNAKAFVYFVVFFTSVIPADLPAAGRATLVVVMPMITLSWYTMISLAFSRDGVRRFYARAQKPLDLVFGALLVFIGVEVALAF